jgi:hypothetical protein
VGLADDLTAASPPPDQDADLRAANRRLQVQLVRAKAKTEDLVEAVYQAVGDALVANPVRPVPPPRTGKRKADAEVALWHLTDWQGGKLTPTYSSAVMHERVRRYCDKAERITAIERSDHPVRDAFILFGGDMVEGLFQFPTQAFEVDATIFDQYVSVSHLLAETVLRALAIYDRVTVIAEWGNHGRIGSRRDAVPRYDNFDRMAYHAARLELKDQPRLTWEDSAEDIQRVEIGNYRALSMHSDEVGRTGWVSEGTFLNYIHKLKAGGYGWDFRDVYTGHRHVHGEFTLSDGSSSWFLTGSTESANRYARNGLGVTGEPSQRLHFIEPDRGVVTSQYKVRLDR